MRLSKKYGIEESTIKAMVKDGVIGCHWIAREDICACYSKNKEIYSSQNQAISQTSVEMKCSESSVWRAIRSL